MRHESVSKILKEDHELLKHKRNDNNNIHIYPYFENLSLWVSMAHLV